MFSKSSFRFTSLRFASPVSTTYAEPIHYGLHGFDNGNAFYGTEGYMIFSRRGAFIAYESPKDIESHTFAISEKAIRLRKNLQECRFPQCDCAILFGVSEPSVALSKALCCYCRGWCIPFHASIYTRVLRSGHLHVAACVILCTNEFIMVTDDQNHPGGCLLMNTGDRSHRRRR